jgi:TolB-like protein/Tfp pilus assembly protein PilF
MFTDMVGYTALGQRNESLSLALVEEQRKLIRPILGRHSGKEIKTMGDAFLVEFPSALDAVRCAYDIQRATREFNISLPDEKRIHLRVGVHLGDVVESRGDISGDAVNVASRIEPLAEDGGVCVTRQVYDHIQNKFELKLASLGVKPLKNVSIPIEVYKMMMPWYNEKAGQVAHLDKKRIAVLPFANISPDPADEYFADGLTEELIGTISKMRELSVISRTSVMQYKDKSKPIPEIGGELNAGTILEGSVRKAGNRVRVSIQMIEATEDKHLWAENYDREIQDIFSVQSDIASRVADALKVELLAGEKKGIGKVLTNSVEAHNLYLKGVYHLNRGSPSDVERAIEYFELACEQDPGFALAYTMVAYCYVIIAGESMPAQEAFPKAKDFLARALSLDEGLAEAHNVQAMIANQYDWDWAATERSFKEAVSLNPSLAEGHVFYAWFLAVMGRFDEAISEATRAHELDPVSPFTDQICGVVYWMAGKNDRARELFTRILEIYPNFARAHLLLALINAMESKTEEAVKEADRTISISDEALFREFQAQVYALVGLKEKSREIVNGLLSKKFKGYTSPKQIGLVYYMLGEKDSGYQWTQKAYEARDVSLPMMNKWPTENVAREDPRFIELLNRMKLP